MRGMSVIALGLNHTTAPLDLRGRFAFTLEQIPLALQGFRGRLQRAGTAEAALLSTCNRTELYVAGEPGQSKALVQPAIESWNSLWSSSRHAWFKSGRRSLPR